MSSSTIGTFSGLRVDPLSLRVNDINIIDIAHSLSLQCRFGGHIVDFFSVAQHCVNVSNAVPPQDALWGLLHDATEAYLKDIPTPLKKSHVFAPYRELEDEVLGKIAEAFALPMPMPQSVRDADIIELLTEGLSLHPSYGEWWKNGSFQHLSPRAEKIKPLPAWRAEDAFLNRYYELTGAIV